MISLKRAELINDMVSEFGDEYVLAKLNLGHETLSRYKRLYRSKFKPQDIGDPKVKILFMDTETSPMEAYIWRLFKSTVDFRHIKKRSMLLCWSAKWAHEDVVFGDRCTGEEVLDTNDRRVTQSLYNAMNEADVVIAHNLANFDKKVFNTFCLINGMKPPLPYREIDTLATLKDTFRFPSNKMDAICDTLGLTRKIETNFDLWVRCCNGDDAALEEMARYCDGDIVSLEAMYMAIMPWMKGNVNFGVYSDELTPACSHCGSDDLHLTDGYKTTSVSRFPVYRCNKCGGLTRSRVSELALSKRRQLLTSL